MWLSASERGRLQGRGIIILPSPCKCLEHVIVKYKAKIEQFERNGEF